MKKLIKPWELTRVRKLHLSAANLCVARCPRPKPLTWEEQRIHNLLVGDPKPDVVNRLRRKPKRSRTKRHPPAPVPYVWKGEL